jgi:hypothetical protein
MSKRLTFEPLPIQYKVWKLLFDNETTQILFGGAARVSKSYLLVAWATIYCLAYPNIHGALCRSRLTSLKKTTLQTLFEFFRHQDLKEDRDFVFNRGDMIITFNNGSKLFFMELYNNPSDPDFTRIMSMSLTFAGVDEASEISETAINMLQTRLSHMLIEYNLKPKLLIVSNPNKNWLYSKYYKPYVEGTLPKYRKVVLGLPDDNKFVSKDYIANLEQLDTVTVQRLRYGNWEYSDDDLAIFEYDVILQMFYNDVASGDMYLTCDVANIGKDKTVICIWKGLECFNIYTYDKYNTPQIIATIKEKMKTFNIKIKNVVIDADGLGIGVADHLKGCVPFKGGSSALNKENYINLRSQCYFKLAERMVDMRMVDKHKEEIIQELQAHRIKNPDNDGKTQVESKDLIKQRIGRSPDFSDTIMMRMYFEIKKPRQKTFVY